MNILILISSLFAEFIKRQFKSSREQKFWHSLESLEDIDKLLPFLKIIQVRVRYVMKIFTQLPYICAQ